MNLTERDRELRKFGLSLGLGLTVLSTILKLKGKPYLYPASVSLLITLTALIKPKALQIIKNILERFIGAVANLITWILLVLLFYLVITPLGLIAKLFRREFLKLKFEERPSYFEKRPLERHGKAVDKEAYEKQF